MSTPSLVVRPPRTDDELWEFVRVIWGFEIPRTPVCSNHATPFQAFAHAYFARAPVIVWKASRGFGGKSNLLSILGVTEQVALGAEVNILGGSGQQSESVIRRMAQAWNAPRAPRSLLATEPGRQEVRLTNGATARALLCSHASVRGPHPPRLRIDEVDEVDIPILDAALGQPMTQRGVEAQTVLSSTHQHPDGTMTEVLHRATEKGWPVFEWCVAGDTMVLTPQGERAISTLKAGGAIYGYDEECGAFRTARIGDVWSNGIKSTIRVITDAGTLECTPGHRVLTDRGWREAKRLRPADRVLGLRPLDPREQEPHGPLLEVLPATVSPEEGPLSGGHALRMWSAEAAAVRPVPALLPAGDGRPEQARSGSSYDGERDGTLAATALLSGGASGGAIRGVGIALHDQLPDRAIRRGLPPSRPRCDRGGLRPAASHAEGVHRSGSGTGAGGPSGRPRFRGALRPRSASVVAIAPGRDVEVWDLSVPGLHSFVANGLVAHNCYRETEQPHGWLSQAEIARKRIELTASMWKVEIELQEPAAEGRAILTDAVEAMFLKELGEFAGDDRELVAIEPPSIYSRYGTGIDWAKQKDWTVITTLKADANPFLLVAFERLQRRPWPEMVAHADARVKAYPGAAFHGALGVGDVVSDYVTTNIEGFIEAGRDRQDLFTEYIAGIERGEVRAPRIDFAYRQHRYCRNEDLFKASGHPPDSFVAGALAYRAARSISGAGSPVRAGGTRSSGGMPSREGMPL